MNNTHDHVIRVRQTSQFTGKTTTGYVARIDVCSNRAVIKSRKHAMRFNVETMETIAGNMRKYDGNRYQTVEVVYVGQLLGNVSRESEVRPVVASVLVPAF